MGDQFTIVMGLHKLIGEASRNAANLSFNADTEGREIIYIHFAEDLYTEHYHLLTLFHYSDII